MAKSGLKHIDVGAELTKTEWESEDSHELLHGSSFPGSPVERQLFYRDDEHKWYIYTGAAWTELTGGGGGGMSDHGNEYHTPDFATEAALSSHAAAATGVHGAGASTVENAAGSQAKVDAHKDLTTGCHGVGADTIAKKGDLPQVVLHAYLYNGGTNQQLPSGVTAAVMLDTEVTDSLGAFDSSVKAGTTTATTANHLIDTTLNPFVAGDVGRKVWNTTDDTYTYITAYNSPSDVTVANDIFVSGEGYKAYFARFVAPSAMEVVVFVKVDVRFLADGKYLQLQILKNGTTAASELRYFSGASQLGLINMSTPIILAANDYIHIDVTHDVGTKQYITAVSGGATWMKIVKLRTL